MLIDQLPEVPVYVVVTTGATTVLLASALAYLLLRSSQGKATVVKSDVTTKSVSKEDFPGGSVTVYFASQTGTAESFAKQLEREGPRYGFLVHVVDLENMAVEDLVDESKMDNPDEKMARAIFLTATYGEGEPPDNATAFVKSLAEKAATEILFDKAAASNSQLEPQTILVGLEYCVFGLGNRQYDHYNSMGKFFDHAMERVGGKRILELGLGDDDDDLERDFESWKDEKLWPALKERYLAADAIVPIHDRNHANGSTTKPLPDCPYVIEYHDASSQPTKFTLEDVHNSGRHYFTAVDCPVSAVRELRTPEDPGSTIHVEIDVSQASGFTYQTADNLGVLPMNEASIVESVAKSLNLDLDAVFSLRGAPHHEWHGAPFPMPISVRECLARYCDLTSAPRRSDLKLLAEYAQDPTDQKALLRMSAKEGRAEYKEKILDEFIGLVDLLKRCPSIEMPLEHFLTVCPLMQTRFFTISSSSSVHPSTVHLTVSVVESQRKDGSLFKGVCSNYLASCQPGQHKIRVFNRPSSFRLPRDSAVPIILIGPGTGLAPMRALLQERAYQRDKLKQKVGKNILYFGCKKKSQDFIYKEELEAFQKSGILSNLRVAFSREQSEKVYVQHLLRQDGRTAWELIHRQGAYIYVCGGVKMGQDVSEALREIVSEQGKQSSEEAKEYLAKLASNGRFVQELWA